MKKMILIAFTVTLLSSAHAMAAEIKIAYVDIKTALENTKAFTQAQKRMEAMQNKKKKQLEAMRKRVADLDKELQMQSMAMSNKHLASKQDELNRLKTNFDRELQDAGGELKREKRKLDNTMYVKFYDVVRAYGKKHNLDIILPKSATIYTNGTHDITADITKILDQK